MSYSTLIRILCSSIRYSRLLLNTNVMSEASNVKYGSDYYPASVSPHMFLHTSATVQKAGRKHTANRKAKSQWLTDQKIEKAREKREMQKNQIEVKVYHKMTVEELADSLQATTDDIFELLVLSKNKNINKYDSPHSVFDDISVVTDIVKKCSMRPIVVPAPKSVEHAIERQIVDIERRVIDWNSDSVKARPPVVTIMGHVDHGKTTLLDTLRKSNVVSTEHGGITQHIGAFSVSVGGGSSITFVDTPGHAAFHSMRCRGAHMTDVVVLVVACDDGVMEQTVESVRFARQANVPLIVALNKWDKLSAGAEGDAAEQAEQAARAEQCWHQLLEHTGLTVEQLGGDVQCVPISALTGYNVELLTQRHVSKRFKRQGQTDYTHDDDGTPKLPIIIRGDVDGSIEALLDVLVTYDSSKCKLDIMDYGVGRVKEGDVDMAALFNGVIFAFNTACSQPVEESARTRGVPIKRHNVIYKLVEDLISTLNSRLPLLDVEHVIGEATVLQQFLVSINKKQKVAVAGCLVNKGTLDAGAMYKLWRDDQLLFQGECRCLKHLSDEVRSVAEGTECGVMLGDKLLHFTPGDLIQCYNIEQETQTIQWTPPGF